jgi:hypothetical protein
MHDFKEKKWLSVLIAKFHQLKVDLGLLLLFSVFWSFYRNVVLGENTLFLRHSSEMCPR